MQFVFLCIFCSVMVSVMFKLARRYHIDVLQAITWNFTAAITLIWFLYKPDISVQTLSSLPTYPYITLGVLMPLLFLVLAASVRINGIVLTVIVERLALFIPLVVTFLLFNVFDNVKIIGLALCFAAVVCLIPWQRPAKKSSKGWVYIIATFIGLGIILTLFRRVGAYNVPNITSFFIVCIIAFLVSLLLLAVQIYRKKTRFSVPHILIGWVMGFAFLGYTIFNLQIHKVMATQPRAAFSSLNVGIITLAMMVGLFIFNERLTKLNKVGIFLALIAIIIVANTDLVNAF